MNKKTKITFNWKHFFDTLKDFFMGIVWGVCVQAQMTHSEINKPFVITIACIAIAALFISSFMPNNEAELLER